MPRNGSGTYSLPAGNPVVSGTTIESSWANTTLSDIGTAMTDSLSRSGQGGMTAAFRAADGTSSVPGIAWSNETGSGFYRAGAADTRLVITTSEVQKWLSTGTAITGTFSATGNVGFGTTSPTFGSGTGVEIERAGIATLRLENSSASNSFELYVDSAANGINLRGRDSSPMLFWTGNTERFQIGSAGQLGIAGANYGTSGQVLVSQGAGAAPQWANSVLPSSDTTWTGTQTFSGTSSKLGMVINNAAEACTVSATAATGTVNYDVTTQSVLFYTTNASGNWTVNLRASAGTTLNAAMSTGQSVTVVFLATQGTTAYYNTTVQVDGTTSGVTTRWQGGAAPTAGFPSGVDVYSYTVIKTGSGTFSVFASQTRFA